MKLKEVIEKGLKIELSLIISLETFPWQKIVQAKRQHKSFIWLGVWKKNSAAITFYKKQGFEEFGEHVFHFSGEEQVDLVMRLLVG